MLLHLEKDPASTTLRYPDFTNWDDLRFPATGIRPPGLVGDPDVDTTDGTFLFDAASTETIAGIAQMPHSWVEGSSIRPHIHWQATNGNAGNVLWRFEYDMANVGENFSGSFTAMDIVAAASGNANTHSIKGFGDLVMKRKKLSVVIKWKLSRIGGDALDTYAADAKLLEIDFHYQIGSVGSGEEFVK